MPEIKGQKQAAWMDISPEVAKELYDRTIASGRNFRTPSQQGVAPLERDMRNGNWHDNGVPIIKNCDGFVLDGLHRLVAVIQSGKTTNFLVVSGITDDRGIDPPGNARTLTKHLIRDGYKQAKDLATSLRFLWLLLHGNPVLNAGPATIDEYRTLARKHPGLSTYIRGCRDVKAVMPLSIVATVTFFATPIELRGADEIVSDEVKAFIAGVATGENLQKNDPRLTLRERMIRHRLSKEDHISQAGVKAYTAIAWNHHVDGQPLSPGKLKWRQIGDKAEAFPEIRKLDV